MRQMKVLLPIRWTKKFLNSNVFTWNPNIIYNWIKHKIKELMNRKRDQNHIDEDTKINNQKGEFFWRLNCWKKLFFCHFTHQFVKCFREKLFDINRKYFIIGDILMMPVAFNRFNNTFSAIHRIHSFVLEWSLET